MEEVANGGVQFATQNITASAASPDERLKPEVMARKIHKPRPKNIGCDVYVTVLDRFDEG